MARCLELARKGAGHVAPNPMVGAVLVHNDRILAEGWHRQYGAPHAEVNCIEEAVDKGYRELIPRSTLYVSLEPCAHYGKTPPCTDLIIRHKIPEVVIGCRDPFPEVNGKGIEKLEAAGLRVVTGVLEQECRELNRRFFTFHTMHRPYVLLKWAQTADGKMAAGTGRRLLISNEYTNRLVHRWRSEEAAILVGTHTALYDDPALTNRLWPGPSPVRMVVDMKLRLPLSLKLFDGKERTIVFNRIKQEEKGNLNYVRVKDEESLVQEVLQTLYQLKLQSVMVEGGARLLQSFISEGAWDEATVIMNNEVLAGEGLLAPLLTDASKISTGRIANDTIGIFYNKKAGIRLTTHD
ncbi:MAG: bifunctional diaminohydroxyphosphoribosylaminopyrimidine deaminase/5-amino-6-(5-phosphoribosylamino)uracil reductase RibD [Chitinophagaceae bacterium]